MLDLTGERIDSLIQRGREIVLEAFAEFQPVVKIIAAYSGGNDSVVTSHFAVQEFRAPVLHCHTGIGLRIVRDHVHRTAGRFGWDLIVKHATAEGRTATTTDDQLPPDGWMDGATSYEEYVLNFGFAGPGQHYRMYQRLKERAIREYVRELKDGTPRGTRVIIISGIRHGESAVRAGYKRSVQKNGAEVWVNPFYWESAADFEMYRQEFGLPRNPVKDRLGISGECLCGAFSNASPGERAAIRAIEPDTADYLDHLEARVKARGFPWNWGCRPPKWWMDSKRGQNFLFDSHADSGAFMPMCVGCVRRSSQ